MAAPAEIAVIIPVASEDESWRRLLPDLHPLPAGSEIWLVGPGPQPEDLPASGRHRLRWYREGGGRARQQNLAARATAASFLWFLHGDSRVDSGTVAALLASLADHEGALHYSDLVFLRDGPGLTRLNQWGAYWRCRLLGLPFGDQGLCLSRDLFWRCGGFDEGVRLGEDHLLVWQARRRRIPVVRTGGEVYTSARKYARQGWARTTAGHLFWTYWQALPQWIHTLKP